MLVQVLTAPFAVIADAVSVLGSALFLNRIRPGEPPAGKGDTSVTAGARFIARDPIVRASLTGIAVVNLFNAMLFALYLLYAVRTLHLRPGAVGLVLGAGAVGGLIGAAVTKRIAARLGAGLAYVTGCFIFAVPQVLVPLASGPRPLVLVMLFAAEFGTGFGVVVLDISIGAIFAAVIPDDVRSRVTGAFQAVNYGARPLGAVLGGFLGSAYGLRPALWVAVAGGITGAALLLPSPIPRYRLPAGAGRPIRLSGK